MSEERRRDKTPTTSDLLGIAFVVLKLTGNIDWDWAWVTAPFWVPIWVAFVVILCGGGKPKPRSRR